LEHFSIGVGRQDRHREERSDEAAPGAAELYALPDCFAALAMTFSPVETTLVEGGQRRGGSAGLDRAATRVPWRAYDFRAGGLSPCEAERGFEMGRLKQCIGEMIGDEFVKIGKYNYKFWIYTA
jgi:hypothetical protein